MKRILGLSSLLICSSLWATPQSHDAHTTTALSPVQVNAISGAKFLARNAHNPNIKTTPSGLQYQILKQGTGKKPTLNSTITVDYEGKLIDGTVFDSSFKRHEPIEFPLKNVITGWQEGIPLIKEGGSIMLYIPAKLAYGAEDNVSIPPNSVLIFKVNLLRVK
ncbi:FKBP-type peptidyl-prolyl cis-trans isomerase [Acinetobacter sp. MD2]|nr:FKBP-type peptidyl-prolyl cis-trans isomerase [Acinetobacter sp. MD2]